MTNHEVNIDKPFQNEKPTVPTTCLRSWFCQCAGPFMQPSLRPGTIGVVPHQQSHAHNAGRFPRILGGPVRHIGENRARGRRWWRWWRGRDLDKHWQAYLWDGRAESRDIRPQPVQRLVYVGHFCPGRGEGVVDGILDGLEVLLDALSERDIGRCERAERYGGAAPFTRVQS